jgi:hypothetical protein
VKIVDIQEKVNLWTAHTEPPFCDSVHLVLCSGFAHVLQKIMRIITVD